jgi:isopentenyl-diphosphate delta-isomerase
MAPAEDEVILVDSMDREIGVGKKSSVHQLGLLHRAFSVFLFDNQGRLLTQRRALGKYHSGGRWANSCCGHPRPGESTHLAAVRRVRQELGVLADVTEVGAFIYRADVGPSLTEHEMDHVFVGELRGDLAPDPREICGLAWVSIEELRADLDRRPARYAAWLAGALVIAIGVPVNAPRHSGWPDQHPRRNRLSS